jgi:hypothetical protein
MLANLALATVMVATTVVLHFWGMLGLTWLLQGSSTHLRPHQSRRRQASLILLVVFGIFALHTVEIWLYAILYRGLNETSGFDAALYFATITFVSLGSGDVLLSDQWRLVGAIEAANGVILLGWSTAFLMSVTSRLKLLEHAWLEAPDVQETGS